MVALGVSFPLGIPQMGIPPQENIMDQGTDEYCFSEANIAFISCYVTMN